jgi:hypothetical protein
MRNEVRWCSGRNVVLDVLISTRSIQEGFPKHGTLPLSLSLSLVEKQQRPARRGCCWEEGKEGKVPENGSSNIRMLLDWHIFDNGC